MSSKPIFPWAIIIVFFFLVAAAAAITTPAAASSADREPTCVPTLQRLLSCLDFIEHRTDTIPLPCCVQVNSTVAQQPCCLMHVLRGDVGRLMGPEFDSVRAMVNVTTKCLGDASVLMSITRSCAGKPLPPLTPEYPFSTALPATSSSGALRAEGWSYASLILAFVAIFV
ncbi:non-specific lipid-transfer protein C6 [Brachypodium distachyon]|uniref:Bifunctional inhibitor/plant lipid transfer protein/seed storage helical domain-containing protein n=1 Tax=Brachypodium distachyon TaxID=15368 RepID=I1H2G2_BRADI|nr:non-specific lipid-transfer protein C6 [Brachypodium distachyon]KQK20268.1 hypothetical protein BRADI_1g53450v3 [Brachypodium distachyon]|eukprot:XP_003561276.1 non-specific lipid-transfer protein C6 [Brachypodium distachyon]